MKMSAFRWKPVLVLGIILAMIVYAAALPSRIDSCSSAARARPGRGCQFRKRCASQRIVERLFFGVP